MGFSFVHVSDIHLDRPFSDLSKYSADIRVKSIYKKAVEKSVNNMIDYVLSNQVDFVLIAGDTFDSGAQDFESKLILKNALKKLDKSGVKVFLICGNHDPLNSYNKITFDFCEDSNIKIVGLNCQNPSEFTFCDKTGEQIALIQAWSFTDSVCGENPVRYFHSAKSGIFNIGLLHCDLDASKESPYAPCLKSELDALNFNYWALGHIHKPDSEPCNIRYAGTLQGRNTKETGNHGFMHITVENGQIIENKFVCSDVVRFEDVDADITDSVDLISAADIVIDSVNSVLNGFCDLFLIRVKLIGLVDFYNEINDNFFNTLSERIKTDTQGKVLVSQFYNNTSAKANIELIKSDDGISGAVYNTVQNEDNITNAFNITAQKFDELVKKCNFENNEYENFKQEVSLMVKESCINLCSAVYNKESADD